MSFAVKRFVAILAFAWAFVAMGAPASAEDATGPALTAVNNKKNELAGTALAREYYAKAVNTVPQVDRDGSVYQFFSGSRGDGAIYWTSQFGAHIVYGAFLDYFLTKGKQEDIGYPVKDPVNGPGDGCPEGSVLKRQIFARIHVSAPGSRGVSTSTTTLCWGPKGTYKGILIGL